MANLKHKHYNRIRSIIINPDNTLIHLYSIKNLIRNFEKLFGNNRLSQSLNELHNNYFSL